MVAWRGAEKRRARVDDLLARFEDVRRREQLDETAAEMLRRAYVWISSAHSVLTAKQREVRVHFV
jgi:hypothetical protein